MEYLAENARLRQLSRRHSEGQLSAADYRSARREILEALEAGQAQTGFVEPEPVAESPSAVADDAEATGVRAPEDATVFLKTMPPTAGPVAASLPPPPAAGWDGNTRVLAVVLGVSLLLALGALVYVFAL